MVTDTSEQGLERLICTSLAGHPCDPNTETMERPEAGHDGAGWRGGNWRDYDREYCVDRHQLGAFLHTTQPKAEESLALGEDGPTRRKFLARLLGEITKRGTIDVLRHGIRHGAHDLTFFYGTPSPDNEQAKIRFAQNRFTITRQLRYSCDETQRALDIVLFINGLPIITFELKNNLTKQTVADAIEQYRNDRNPRERLFELGRCVSHFAADEAEARFCTHLEGKKSWFLPFNRGWNDGTGNPPNPDGLKTDYLWREVLTRESLTDILENYAQLVEVRDEQSGKKTRKQIWPRYHQVDVVRRLLEHAAEHGVGQCYLIQHSAGSGKSNSIAWLAHQLIRLEKNGNQIFDSIIVVTDRRILDRNISDTIRQSARIAATIGHAEHSGDLRRFIESGKKIIISTVQKFPFILDEIGNEQRGRRFAIIIDEAHSSQGGRTSAAMAQALSESGAEGGEETFEDRINRLMESRQLLSNASYFAFTATPKNKTLEIFGEPDPQPDGTVRHHAFHRYTMKQATEEGFILDVLSHYTPVTSYYKLAKTIENDPEFDASKARKKLRRFVEGHDHAIRLKAEIMVDHFHDQVLSHRKIGGEARAMVVTGGVERAIQYFNAIRSYLVHRKSPYQAIVAFSGEREFGGEKVSETSLNRFPSKDIEKVFRKHPYRILVCADKFQTGYDEPLLHTMYVDKILSGIQAVQTLSRLNRAHPKKHDVFVLDFQNDAETIHDAFTPFYRTTILSDETDPDKLHDLQADLDNAQVYTSDQVQEFVQRYLDGAGRDQIDPVLDACVAVYKQDLDEDQKVDFKGKAKGFVRTYSFLSCVLPWTHSAWEMRSIFLNFLIPKLPAPKDKDLSRGILEAIDMESYRVEMQAARKIHLPDEDGEIEPVPASGGGHHADPDMDRLSNIISQFNDLFGNIAWEDEDRIRRLITETIPERVATDAAYLNAREHSDEENARIEFDRALKHAMNSIIKDDHQLYKQFMDNDSFRRWMTENVFVLTERSENYPNLILPET
ncbi:MAG: type I restriction endonuclease subunit R [Gammaproteobacteria bacterium]|nr:type I restriction endonuclease subunit R [Gammaproteobacteria bacterium]